MATKKELNALKQKLSKENPGALKGKANRIDKRNLKKKVISKNIEEEKVTVVKWNFKVNQLVKNKYTEEIGVIISDTEYRRRRVTSNHFFVLFGETVKQVSGGMLSSI